MGITALTLLAAYLAAGSVITVLAVMGVRRSRDGHVATLADIRADIAEDEANGVF